MKTGKPRQKYDKSFDINYTKRDNRKPDHQVWVWL